MSYHYQNGDNEFDVYRQREIDGLYEGGQFFTNLESCSLPADSDSQSSYSKSSDSDDDVQQIKTHFYSLTNGHTIEPNVDMTENENNEPTIANLDSSDDIIELIRTDLYKFIFESISEQISNYVQCRVKRDYSGSSRTVHLEVECNNNGKLRVLRADKQLKLNGQSQYKISVVSMLDNHLHSAELLNTTATGTGYALYLIREDERQELANISYEANFLGLKGPRKIEVLLPKLNDPREYSIDENDAETHQQNCLIRLHNKPPEWDPDTCYHKLHFNGIRRVLIPSIKNFQLMIKNRDGVEKIVMEFGRMTENEFSCDFRYPLSLIQAFGIALSALESRLFRG